MDNNWHSGLKDARTKIEAALEAVDSDYEKDREALELKYKVYRESLQQALGGVKAALREDGNSEVDSQTIQEETGQANLSLAAKEFSDTINPDGFRTSPTSPSGQTSKVTQRFSARREIEKLLSEFDPHQDIKQGEVRHELERRFPEHKSSLQASTISSALRRMANAGSLVKVSDGTGSEPNVYRLPRGGNSKQDELRELAE